MPTQLSPRMQDYLESILKLQASAPVVRAGEARLDQRSVAAPARPAVSHARRFPDRLPAAAQIAAEPGYVAHTAKRLAELREMTPEALAALTTANFRRLFPKTACG